MYVSPKVSKPEPRLARDRDVRARVLSYKDAAASPFCCLNEAQEKALREVLSRQELCVQKETA